MELSLAAARALHLHAQGLTGPRKRATKADVLEAVRRMDALQIDTISVVARSQLFVLWTRLGDFEPEWLNELLAEGKLFEYWSHAACYLPAEDFRLYRPAMKRHGWRKQSKLWRAENAALMDRMRDRLRAEGPLRTKDLEHPDDSQATWWGWRPEKRAIEELYYSGEVTIVRRERFQRVYDLIESARPEWLKADPPTEAEVERAFALKAVKALGITPARWVGDYFRRYKIVAAKTAQALAEEGALRTVQVPELGNEPCYVHPDHWPLVEQAAQGKLTSTVTALLSPFDPVVWDRDRASGLWGFDYRIEIYTPAERRKFGYFTLPILHRGELVGRLCPKAHRKDGVFEVRQLHLQSGIKPSDRLARELADTLRRCAAWHGTPEVVVRETDPCDFREALRVHLGEVSP
jgi:uncharacterized protein